MDNQEIVPLPSPEANRSYLSDSDKELLQLAMDTEHGTPVFKIRHFVGDAQITKYAKYKQLLLEIRSREEMIEQTLVTIEKNKANIEECKELIALTPSNATRKKLEWELVSNTNDMMKTERRLKMMYTERDNYLGILKEMYETGEAYLEDGTDLKQSVIDKELGEKLEAEHWVYRLGKQAALDLIAYGHIGTGNLEAISQLNEETAIRTLGLAMTYSHSVKKALGTMESSIIEAIESGQINSTIKIEKQDTLKELE